MLDYRSGDYKTLFELYQNITLDEVKSQERLDPDTFQDGFMDQVVDGLVHSVIGLDEKKHFILKDSKPFGFLKKKKKKSVEHTILTDPVYTDETKQLINSEFRRDLSGTIQMLKCYINCFQEMDIRILSDSGFVSKRVLFESM